MLYEMYQYIRDDINQFDVRLQEAIFSLLAASYRRKHTGLCNESDACTLSSFARGELEKAGLFDKDSDYAGMLGEAVLELIETFSTQGHSGFSAAMAVDLFSRLANYKPLTPLTSDPDEWMCVTEHTIDGKPLYQSTRCPSAFSCDGGKTYYDIDEDGQPIHTIGDAYNK